MIQRFARPILFSGLLLLAVPAATALACKCRPLTPQEGVSEAQVMFEGRVTKIAEEAQVPPSEVPPGKLITLSVVRTWKGLENEEVVNVRTSESSASCGYEFALNTSYLVYASNNGEMLSVTTCSRTRPMSEAAEDLALLGAGNTPVKVVAAQDAGASDAGASDAGTSPGAPPSVKQGGCASTRGGQSHAGVGLLGMPLVGMALRRRRKAQGAKQS